MTLNKIIIPSFIIIVLAACSKNSDDLNEPGDYGYHLAFRHVPTDTVIVLENDYQPTIIDTSCADLHICIMSSLREELGHLTPQHYFFKGDAEMEQQIKEFLDPEGKKYNGTIPIHIDYTTEACQSIRFMMYNKDDIFISDITDEARFYYIYDPNSWEEEGQNLLIDSNGKLLGKIKMGTTIAEYLSCHPMLFAQAHFIFPGLQKDIFANGNYVKVEIELANGFICANGSRGQPRIWDS